MICMMIMNMVMWMMMNMKSDKGKKGEAKREMLTIFNEDLEQGLYHGKRLCDCLDVGWLKPGRICKNFFEVFGTPGIFDYIREKRTLMEIAEEMDG